MTEPGKSMGDVAQQISWRADLMLCMQAGFEMLSRCVGVLSFQVRSDHLYQRRSFQSKAAEVMGAQSAKELYVLGLVRSYKVVLPQYT